MASVEMDVSGLKNVQFGQEIREKEFCLCDNSVFLNTASFGNVPKRVLDIQKRYLDLMESYPDKWFRIVAFEKWNESRQVVADLVGADVEDVVFVVNATSGVNTVMRSLKFASGDAILGSSLTYGALKNLWHDMVENICPKGVEGLLMEIKLPIVSEDAVVQQYDDYLTQHPNVKFVLIDHITSPSAILMPVKRLAAVCHKHGALVMVDGAHTPGQLPLNLRDMGADFYTGNLHKWAFSPRGCALLWVKREHHGAIRPPLTSWWMGKSLSEQFFKQGTRDHVPFVCAKQALQFYQAIGGMDKVVGYTSDLATKGRDLLAEELGLEKIAVPQSMEAPNIRMLRLPAVPAVCISAEGRDGALRLKESVYEKENIQTTFGWVDGALYLRLSVQVHNTLEDIRKFAPVLKRVLSDCVPYEE